MGTFAETAIVGYRLSFVDQRKPTSVFFRFRFQSKQTGSLPFSVSSVLRFAEFRKHGGMETWRYGDMEIWRHGDMETRKHGDMKS
jgi:hypothetical protein